MRKYTAVINLYADFMDGGKLACDRCPFAVHLTDKEIVCGLIPDYNKRIIKPDANGERKFRRRDCPLIEQEKADE
jgi:hypothetical protein